MPSLVETKAILVRPKIFGGMSQQEAENKIFWMQHDTPLTILGVVPRVKAPPSAYVIGPSWGSIYERFFNKPLSVGGGVEEEARFVRLSLFSRHAKAILVQPDEFTELIQMGKPEELRTKLQKFVSEEIVFENTN